MKLIYIYIICVFVIYNSKAQQNLILNPSFEQLDSCPINQQWIEIATFWQSINPYPCTTLLFNKCCNDIGCSVPYNDNGGGLDFQWPRTGNGFIGMEVFSPHPPAPNIPDFRRYAKGILSQVLINGKIYCGKVYVNLSNISPYKVNQFGMYFDNGALIGSQAGFCKALSSITPQINNNSTNFISDTLGWIKIEGSFMANGTENSVTIGNFKTDLATIGLPVSYTTSYQLGYFNVDDLSLIPIEIKALAGRDTSICVGDSINIGRSNEVGIDCNWYNLGNATPFANTSNIWYKPTATGTITLVQSMDNCMMSYDTINVVVCNSTGIRDISYELGVISVVPNPTNGLLTISSRYEFDKIELLSITGQTLVSKTVNEKSHLPITIGIQLQNFADGIYFVNVIYTNGLSVTKKIVVNR